MAFLIDTGFLYAVIDRSDANHHKAQVALSQVNDDILVLPTLVLVEITYLILTRLGHHKMQQFIQNLQSNPWQFEAIEKEDLNRIARLLEEYADNELDFVDAAITALAERLNITTILTVDQRHFRAIRPIHCRYFEILP